MGEGWAVKDLELRGTRVTPPESQFSDVTTHFQVSTDLTPMSTGTVHSPGSACPCGDLLYLLHTSASPLLCFMRLFQTKATAAV